MKKIILGLSALALMAMPGSASAACAGPGSFQVCASMSVGNVRYVNPPGVWKFDLTVTEPLPRPGRLARNHWGGHWNQPERGGVVPGCGPAQ